MDLLNTEAIVLQAIPFKEYDRILTLFSPQGLLKFFVKVAKKEYLHLAALTSPLTLAEFHYTPGRKGLHRLVEGTILKQNIQIRESYTSLIIAEKMVYALLQSQWPDKPAPKLFALFILLLEHLPTVKEPSSFLTLFLLKLLRHEGLLQLSTPLQAVYRFAGERYSQKEAPPGALLFTEEEEELLTSLALTRFLPDLKECTLSTEFQKKIEILSAQTFSST
jgi:DNA repair protein RecO (recombination protein O)